MSIPIAIFFLNKAKMKYINTTTKIASAQGVPKQSRERIQCSQCYKTISRYPNKWAGSTTNNKYQI